LSLLSSMESSSDKPSILKTTREAKGLTLEIVHEATKIPMDALRAIEEGYSVRILSPFYYRGFIKIYAEFLGLNVGEMYKQYGLDQAPSPTTSATVSVKASRPDQHPVLNRFTGSTPGVGVVSLILKPKTLKLIFKVIGFLLLLLLFFKMAGCIASHLNKKGISSKKQMSFLAQEKKVTIHQSTNHGTIQAQSENNKVEVAVRATRDIWLLVKADGRVVFETTLSKGSMESWVADNHIELSGGDLELLDMEINEKHIGFLGGGERKIRKVLITQEGLTVKK